MARVGIIESTAPMNRYFKSDTSPKQGRVSFISLATDVDFIVNLEILQKLNQAKCQLLINETTLSSLTHNLKMAESEIKSVKEKVLDEKYLHN